MFDLHRHTEFSSFDGFGKADDLAALAKSYGYTALGVTDHGNTNGLVKMHVACKNVGIKAILGVEGYFLPKYKPQERGYHLVLVAKNLKGYGNLNRMQYEGEKQKYYNPIWDFDMLEKYSEGLICTSACVAGYLPRCILAGEQDKAIKFIRRMKSIFADDFYIEVQPYEVSDKGMQETVNIGCIKLAERMGVKCILTSDSHMGEKSDLRTYIKMHEIAKHNTLEIEDTYGERYMPKPDDMSRRFYEMHSADYGSKKTKQLIASMEEALEEIEEKCEDKYLDKLELKLPSLHNDIRGETSYDKIVMAVKQGLKKRGTTGKEYIARCKEELSVIKAHGFEDYFLIVADYVQWAKNRGIIVGPGRGSVCNCLVAYALGITDVDSIYFGLAFSRFLRMDKKKFPDIDLDFEPERRQEVIDYICDKYEGKAARLCSYGLYKIDNLVNDLAKVCGLTYEDDDGKLKTIKDEVNLIKRYASDCIDGLILDKDKLLSMPDVKRLNAEYEDVVVHFSKLYGKVRFIGTHAAGVAVTDGDLLDYTALRIGKDGVYTNYDLIDMESCNVVKFDILGLKTMSSISELRKLTGVTVDYKDLSNDMEILKQFGEGKTDGVFQFVNPTAKNILKEIHTDCFEDVVATSSMNRPGPLTLKMPSQYADNKLRDAADKSSAYYEYTKETYGTIVYQEQVQSICVELGKMSWTDSDTVLKMLKTTTGITQKGTELYNAMFSELMEKFVKGAKENGVSRKEAERIFNIVLGYTFNKGHAVGYSLISIEEMFYKVHYPNEFWYVKMKYAIDEAEYNKFSSIAVSDGSVIFLPHVNYSTARTRLRKLEDTKVIQQGLSDIKNVGEKAAQFILEERKQNGIFTSYDNFYDRCKSRTVTSRVIDTLKEQGAIEFDKKVYISRVKKYNSSLYARAMN